MLFALTKYAHFVLYPIHPTTLVNYRRGFRPSGAKTSVQERSRLARKVEAFKENLDSNQVRDFPNIRMTLPGQRLDSEKNFPHQ